MIRTQLSFEAGEISWLRRRARIQGTSMAHVVRDLIHEASVGIKNGGPRSASKGSHPLAAVKRRFPWVGMAKDGPPTDAVLTDDYLYGEGEPL